MTNENDHVTDGVVVGRTIYGPHVKFSGSSLIHQSGRKEEEPESRSRVRRFIIIGIIFLNDWIFLSSKFLPPSPLKQTDKTEDEKKKTGSIPLCLDFLRGLEKRRRSDRHELVEGNAFFSRRPKRSPTVVTGTHSHTRGPSASFCPSNQLKRNSLFNI